MSAEEGRGKRAGNEQEVRECGIGGDNRVVSEKQGPCLQPLLPALPQQRQ